MQTNKFRKWGVFMLMLTGIVSSMNVLAQERDELKMFFEDDLQMRQKQGTEERLKTYLRQADIKEDTVYAMMYKPTSCPRCETFNTAFYDEFKKLFPDKPMLLITAYTDSVAAKAYNEREKFIYDYNIYDTQEEYLNIFSFNFIGDMLGTYLLKINVKQGKATLCGALSNVSTKFVTDFVNCQETMPQMCFRQEVAQEEKTEYERPAAEMNSYREYPLTGNDIPISETTRRVSFVKEHLFFEDQLANGVMLFRKNGNQFDFRTLVQPDSAERRNYIHISEDIYQIFAKDNSFHYIPNMPFLMNDSILAVSYSLPDVTCEGDKFVFFNSACVLSRNINTLEKRELMKFDIEELLEDNFIQHFELEAVNDRIFMRIAQMSWPYVKDKEYFTLYPDRDSFKKEYYDNRRYTMASFDGNSGKIIERFGHLDSASIKCRTGNYFEHSMATHHGDKLVYSNNDTGKIYMADYRTPDETERYYRAFEVDEEAMPEPDSTKFYTKDYGATYERFFYRTISELKMNGNEIACIIRYGNPFSSYAVNATFSFMRIDRKTGERREWRLPEFNDEHIMRCGIHIDEQERLYPFVLLKKNGKCCVRVYE